MKILFTPNYKLSTIREVLVLQAISEFPEHNDNVISRITDIHPETIKKIRKKYADRQIKRTEGIAFGDAFFLMHKGYAITHSMLDGEFIRLVNGQYVDENGSPVTLRFWRRVSTQYDWQFNWKIANNKQ